jgi:hypothetical protein
VAQSTDLRRAPVSGLTITRSMATSSGLEFSSRHSHSHEKNSVTAKR